MKAKTLLIRMKLSPIVIVSALIVVVLSASDSIAVQDKGARLTIVSDKEEYKKDEPISIDFRIKNVGKKEMYINKRFYIIPEDDPKKNGEVYFSVTSPTGEKLPCKVSYETGLPKTDYFTPIKPGEEITMERKPSINYFFDFTAPGVYKIEATYQNRYGEEIGIDAFKGKVVSRQIKVKRIE